MFCPSISGARTSPNQSVTVYLPCSGAVAPPEPESDPFWTRLSVSRFSFSVRRSAPRAMAMPLLALGDFQP